MYKTIKYPYKELSKLELEKLQNYKERHNFTDNEIYVTYTTEESLGIGYDIIVTHKKPHKKDGRWHYGFSKLRSMSMVECKTKLEFGYV